FRSPMGVRNKRENSRNWFDFERISAVFIHVVECRMRMREKSRPLGGRWGTRAKDGEANILPNSVKK
ncbi:MAG: hypothetical protein II330_09190, partial [Clostridia bacterium]|nr:hypothetical protein [Clostridia bacterium]